MKKIALVFISMISIGLSTISCDKDDDKETSIEGKWVFSKEGGSVGGNESLIDYVHVPTCDKDFITFTGSTTTENFHFPNGNNCGLTPDVGTFTRNGSEVKTTIDDEVITYKILNLSDTELKLSEIDVDGEPGNYISVYTKG